MRHILDIQKSTVTLFVSVAATWKWIENERVRHHRKYAAAAGKNNYTAARHVDQSTNDRATELVPRRSSRDLA